MSLIYFHYQRFIGQYFYFASTRLVFFCPFKENNQFSHDIDGVATGIESPFLKKQDASLNALVTNDNDGVATNINSPFLKR